jgi:prevent-host-death family protein
MVKNISVRELRAHFAGVLDGVTKRLDRYVISKRGKPEAILMCIDDYEGWLETLGIMSSEDTMRDIRLAKVELKKGKGLSFKQVFGRDGNAAGKRGR